MIVDDRRAMAGRGGTVTFAASLKQAANSSPGAMFLSELSTNASVLAGLFPPGRALAPTFVSLVPAIRPLGLRGCHWIVIMDCRHVVEPDSFTRRQRHYRDFVLTAAQRTGSHAFVISEATRRVLGTRWPELARRAVVVHPGVKPPTGARVARSAPYDGIAYGHLRNKRADAAVRAWLEARQSSSMVGRLYVVGVRHERDRADLRQLAAGQDAVQILPFLGEADYESVRNRAAIVLFPSSHEGFGLPVLEALVHGQVPVITPDPAMMEAARGHAVVAGDMSDASLTKAVVRATARLAIGTASMETAQAWAATQTWDRTLSEMRAAVHEPTGWRCARCEPRKAGPGQ